MGLNRNFSLLWSGQMISELGSSISTVSVPLAAVTILKATSLQMGFLSAATSLPTLLLAIGAGVVADRISKRRVMLVANGGQALLMAAIALLLLAGRLNMSYLCGLIFLMCALGVFHSISSIAFVPTLVEREKLLSANTRIQGGRAVSSLLGKGLGGFLVALLTAPVALLVDAVSFLVCFVSVSAIRAEEPQKQPAPQASVSADVREGFRFVLREQRVRALLAYAATANMFISALLAIYVLYLARDLRLSAGLVGIIMAMMGVGALAGSVVASRISRQFSIGRILTVVALSTGIGAGLLGITFDWVVGTVAVQCIGMIVFGGAAAIANINLNGMMQAIPPPQLLARIFGIMQFAAAAVMPLGAVVSGVAGQYIHLKIIIELIAAGLLVASLWFILSPISRMTSIASMASHAKAPAESEMPELVASGKNSA